MVLYRAAVKFRIRATKEEFGSSAIEVECKLIRRYATLLECRGEKWVLIHV